MKKKIVISILMVLFSIGILKAQSWQWGRNGGGSNGTGALSGDNKILDMQHDKEGNMYVLADMSRFSGYFMGDTIAIYGYNDMLLYKLDCDGDILWKKQIGDVQSTDGTQNIVLDNAENVYLIGSSFPSSTHGFRIDTDTMFTPPISRSFHSNIIKFDKNGNYKFYKTNEVNYYPGYNLGYKKTSISVDNNIYVLTTVLGNIPIIDRVDTTHLQFYILKYDTNAVLQSYFPVTDSGNINSWSMTGDDRGHIYLSGYTIGSGFGSNITIMGGHQVPSSKTFICKFDTAGVFKWIRMNDDSVTSFEEIKYNKNLHLIVGSATGGSTMPTDSMGTKFGSIRITNPKYSAGGSLWRSIGPVGLIFDTLGSCLYGVAMGSRNISYATTVDVNNTSKVVIGGVSAGPKFDFIVDSNSTIGQDGFFVELTTDLKVLQGQVLNGSGFYDAVTKVAHDEQGNIYVGGYMEGNLVLGSDTLQRLGGGASDFFIAKCGVATCTCPYAVANFSDAYTSSLTYTYTSSALNADSIWWEFGDGNRQSGGSTATHSYSAAGSYMVCQHVSNVCSEDEYCKNIDVVTSIDEVKESYRVIIYPNPANTSLHIHVLDGNLAVNSAYILYDMIGKELLHGGMNGKDTHIAIPASLNDGVYLLQINDAKGKMQLSKRIEVLR